MPHYTGIYIGVDLQARFYVHIKAGLRDVVRPDNQSGFLVISEEVQLRMENAGCFVVIDEGLTVSVRFQVEKGLKAFTRGVLNVYSDNDGHVSAISKEVCKSIRKVRHPRSADPRNGDIE